MKTAPPTTMWQVLDQQHSPQKSFETMFGAQGQRGEYMDGYSKQAMLERCLEDYKWTAFDQQQQEQERHRVDMMSYLYTHPELWNHVCMVAFAEHYVLENLFNKPFKEFQTQKECQPSECPIFSGVVWEDYWESSSSLDKLAVFQQYGFDYVRIHCNFGNDAIKIDDDDDPRLGRLALVTKECQTREMVPLVLIQVPWRESGSEHVFRQIMNSVCRTFSEAQIDFKKVMLETRPPIGISANQEKELQETERLELGLNTGRIMFELLNEALNDNGDDAIIAGFCIAGGSTKGPRVPTAMEDDTQNAVRQGMRLAANQKWGYSLCFWEMGAKLMLQPKVGQLWGTNECDEARELFCANAKAMANEIKKAVVPE